MPIDNVDAGRYFCRTARDIIFGDAEGREWFDQNSLWRLADRYNVSAIFANGGNHFRLVTKLLDNNQVEVYDPLLTRGGESTYIMDYGEIELLTLTGDVFKKSNPVDWFNWKWPTLQDITEEEFWSDEKIRIDSAQYAWKDLSKLLERLENNYSLNMIGIGKVQEDLHNCGPLSVFAALVGNRHTPEFEQHVEWLKVIADTSRVTGRALTIE
tara:strand:+ start:2973 stop:3608 length:636 start_codon:yes stop_codon:yes gene_type:complete